MNLSRPRAASSACRLHGNTITLPDRTELETPKLQDVVLNSPIPSQTVKRAASRRRYVTLALLVTFSLTGVAAHSAAEAVPVPKPALKTQMSASESQRGS